MGVMLHPPQPGDISYDKFVCALLRKHMVEDILLMVCVLSSCSETIDEPKYKKVGYNEIEIEHLFELCKMCNAWSHLLCSWF